MRWSVRIRLTGVAISCLLVLLMFPLYATPARAGSQLRSLRSSPLAIEGDGVHHLGLKPSPSGSVPRAGLPRSYSLGTTLATSVDLSGQLPPVGDQGAQGSCVAWATSYYYKSWSEKQEHTSWSLSNARYQYSPSFMYNQINGGYDNGASFYDALSLLRNTGDVDIAEMPYDDGNYTKQPTAAQREAAKPYRIPSGWGALWNNSGDSPYSNNIESAKAWLDSGQPLVMAIPIYYDFPDFGTNGLSSYYDYDESSDYAGAHGVCICGYDDDANSGGSDADHQGGFKIVNSWGAGWNGGGFVYLSYDFVRRYVWEAWTMGDLSGDGPSISSLSQSSGSIGDSINIYGKNFGMHRRNTRVTFNGTTASQVSFTNAKVTAMVPSGATTGPVVVYDWEGTASNSVTFTVGEKVVKPPPTINSITPNTATRGAAVSVADLSGGGFQPGAGTTVVKLKRSGESDIAATDVAVRSADNITCKFSIPSSAPAGLWNLHVQNPDGQAATKSNAFTIRSTDVTCPTWYLAEGTSDWGFSTYISIGNPNSTPVSAQITYMTPTGQVPGGTVNMPAKSQATVNPADTVGAKDFSTKVVCLEGKTICVDRTMSWTGPGASAPEAHSSVGVTAPAKTWFLAEGCSAWGFETWLLVQNPNASRAQVTLTYMIEGASPVSVTKTVPGNSRQSFNMAEDIGERNASVKVTGNLPVIAERAMYRYNRREGHDSIGATTPALDYYLAEGSTAWGFATYLLVQNPNMEASDVSITLMTSRGPQVLPAFSLPANSRKTIDVNELLPGKDFSTRVHGSRPIIAERSMYWNSPAGEACHDSIGLPAPHGVFYLADGQSSEGRETYTLVQNPNAAAVKVEISYLTPDGAGNRSFTDSVPGNSRRSYDMANVIPSGRAAVVVTCKTPDKKIIVERAMYWDNRCAGTDTIGGYSD